jgi:protein SCO1/2
MMRGSHGFAARLLCVMVVGALSTGCAAGHASGSADPSGDVQNGTKALPFTLLDQFGNRERLADFRGSVVLLTFIDPRCHGICPLTADLMRRAKDAVGNGTRVQLVAIDANPKATSVDDVRRWSTQHGMLHDWLFLTAPVDRLRRVWAGYGVTVLMSQGDVAHASAIFLIDPSGQERGVFPIATGNGVATEVDALARAVRLIA